MVLKEKDIIRYWQDETFSGSFSGVETLYKALKKIDPSVSLSQVRSALENIDAYQMHFNSGRKIHNRRHIHTNGSGLDFSCDIMEMPSEGTPYKYALVMRDEFNLMIYGKPQKTKTADETKSSFQEIFDKNSLVPHTLSTDQGGEFIGLKKYFEKQKIYFIERRGDNKSSVAESAIFRIKARLYRSIRAGSDREWPELFFMVIVNINNTPNSGLGGLIPNEVKDPIYDEKVISSKKDQQYPLWQQQMENAKKSEAKLPFKIGDEVYLTLTRGNFYKSYDVQRGQIYKIRSVDASINPPMYKLEDLAGKRAKNLTFYGAELRKAPPNEKRIYTIEKILKPKKVKGKTFYYVKYAFYPKKQVSIFIVEQAMAKLTSRLFYISDSMNGVKVQTYSRDQKRKYDFGLHFIPRARRC